MVAPGLSEVLFDGAAGGAVVVKASDASVDFERGDEEETALHYVEHCSAESFFVGGRCFAYD